MKYLPGKQRDCSGLLYKAKKFGLWEIKEISLLLVVSFLCSAFWGMLQIGIKVRGFWGDPGGKCEGMWEQSSFSVMFQWFQHIAAAQTLIWDFLSSGPSFSLYKIGFLVILIHVNLQMPRTAGTTVCCY